MSSEYISKDDVYRILCMNVVSHSDGIEAVNKTIYDIEKLDPADVINVADISGTSICGKISDLDVDGVKVNTKSILYAPIVFYEKPVGVITKIIGDMWFGVLFDGFLNIRPSIYVEGSTDGGVLASIDIFKGDWNKL